MMYFIFYTKLNEIFLIFWIYHRIFTRDELERIGSLCLKYNKKIISDEIFSDFVGPPFEFRHIPIASLSYEIS